MGDREVHRTVHDKLPACGWVLIDDWHGPHAERRRSLPP
jgi:hypothetical protein